MSVEVVAWSATEAQHSPERHTFSLSALGSEVVCTLDLASLLQPSQLERTGTFSRSFVHLVPGCCVHDASWCCDGKRCAPAGDVAVQLTAVGLLAEVVPFPSFLLLEWHVCVAVQ